MKDKKKAYHLVMTDLKFIYFRGLLLNEYLKKPTKKMQPKLFTFSKTKERTAEIKIITNL